MKDNGIFSNCISGVSLKRREKNKKVFGEEPDCQSLRAYCEGGEKRGIHMQYVSTHWFPLALFPEGQRAEFLGQRKCSGSVRSLSEQDWPSKFQLQGFSISRARVPLKVQGQRQNICEPQICNQTLQEQVLDEQVWLYGLRTKSGLKVLRGQQHIFVHRYKWEQAQKEWVWLLN